MNKELTIASLKRTLKRLHEYPSLPGEDSDDDAAMSRIQKQVEFLEEFLEELPNPTCVDHTAPVLGTCPFTPRTPHPQCDSVGWAPLNSGAVG